MKVLLNKFGTILLSREAGREALAAFQSQLKVLDSKDVLQLDFKDVYTLTPSWGDEFITPLMKKFGSRLELMNTGNPSVKATLELLEKINGVSFRIVS